MVEIKTERQRVIEINTEGRESVVEIKTER